MQSQYEQVITHELPRLQAAFKQISPERAYKPKLSIIVCGKGHNARFWAPDSEHATKNGNTLPGTVVDKGITDVYLFDFYLQVCVRSSVYFCIDAQAHDDTAVSAF